MIITQTPLRISLAGGGTDFIGFYKNHGGAVVSTAIDKYIFVIVKERFDRKIRVGYTRTEMVDSVNEIQHELVREAMKLVGITYGIEIATIADIPSEGSGLGSSSAVTVGVLNALHGFKGEFVAAEQLAREACKIEIDILGKPIGKQDQYISAYGGLRYFKFNEDDSVDQRQLYIEPNAKQRLTESLLLFYTGVTRDSSSVLSEQKVNISKRLDILVKMREQANELALMFGKGVVASLGQNLKDGWVLKKKLASSITNPEIDEMYELAVKAGAIGGKITGAGGGGFFLVCVPPSNRSAVRKALSHLRELPINLARDGSKIIFNVIK